ATILLPLLCSLFLKPLAITNGKHFVYARISCGKAMLRCPVKLKNCFAEEREESPAHVPYKKLLGLAHRAVSVGCTFVLTNKSQAGCSRLDSARTACCAESGSGARQSARATPSALQHAQRRGPSQSSEWSDLRGVLDSRRCGRSSLSRSVRPARHKIGFLEARESGIASLREWKNSHGRRL